VQQDVTHSLTRTGSQHTGSQQTGSQQTGSQQTGSQRCRRCHRPASASFDAANAATQAAAPTSRTKNFPVIVRSP